MGGGTARIAGNRRSYGDDPGRDIAGRPSPLRPGGVGGRRGERLGDLALAAEGRGAVAGRPRRAGLFRRPGGGGGHRRLAGRIAEHLAGTGPDPLAQHRWTVSYTHLTLPTIYSV